MRQYMPLNYSTRKFWNTELQEVDPPNRPFSKYLIELVVIDSCCHTHHQNRMVERKPIVEPCLTLVVLTCLLNFGTMHFLLQCMNSYKFLSVFASLFSYLTTHINWTVGPMADCTSETMLYSMRTDFLIQNS